MRRTTLQRTTAIVVFFTAILLAPAPVAAQCGTQAAAPQSNEYQYLLLATNKTSTMQKEMNQAAVEGYRFEAVMGGETSFGGKEAVAIMGRPRGEEGKARYNYKLLATQKTSTMQKEMQQMGDEGYEYRGQTVFESSFGGKEVVVILERDTIVKASRFLYKLLATKKTSTMQKELSAAAVEGFQFVGVTVAETSFGGTEVVTILRRKLD
jgi:hypothetical protein